MSASKPSGLSGRAAPISGFRCMRSLEVSLLPPWMVCKLIAGLSAAMNPPVLVYLGKDTIRYDTIR